MRGKKTYSDVERENITEQANAWSENSMNNRTYMKKMNGNYVKEMVNNK